jgi:Rieske Fe-S protein
MGSWQLMPPIVTGKMPVVHSLLKGSQAAEKVLGRTTDTWQIVPPIITGHLAAVKPAEAPAEQQSATFADVGPMVPQKDDPPTLERVAEPSAVSPEGLQRESHGSDELFSSAKAEPGEFVLTLSGVVEPVEKPSSTQKESSSPLGEVEKPHRVSRRRMVTAMLVAGSVAATGALVVGAVNLAHVLHPVNTPSPAQQGKGAYPTPDRRQKQPDKGTHAPTPTKKSQATHTGVVIGSTNLAINSSVDFTNPVDGKASLLIHLPTNSFVAYEQACTHQGVAVHYDAATHTLVCPAHGSVFDPANGGKVLQGPAATPLPSVTVRVNADGTITVG